jgi:hypothetical protein
LRWAAVRSPTYATLEDWVIGRIARHPSMQRSIPARLLEEPPEYLFKDYWDARDVLRELREKQLIAAHSKRFYLTTKGRAAWNELRKKLKA